MSKLNFGSVEAPVLFAAPPKGPVELAAFATADGKKLVSNADRTPYSPDDGAQMQILSSDRTVLSARQVASCVTIGKCPACQSRLVASASMADCIEVASEDIHCPICTAAVTPAIDLNVLTSALRDEFSEDEEGDDDTETADEDFGDDDSDDDDADAGDDADDSDDEDYDDEDYGDDSDDDDADAGDDADDSDDEDYDDEDYGDDSDDDDDDFSDDDADEDFGDDDDAEDSDDAGDDDVDDEIATAAAQLRRRIKKRRLAAKASDDDIDADDADADDEVEAVEASMRKRLKKSKKRRVTAAEDIDDGVVDDAGEPDGDGDEDDMESAHVRRRVPGKFRRKKLVASDDVTDVDDSDADADDADEFSPEENEVIASLASVVCRTYAKHGLALGSTERTVAGRASRRSGKVDAVLASARERLRGREGVDGNRRLKSLVAQAGEVEDIEMNETPAVDDKEGKVNEAVPVDANNPGSATASKVAKAADEDADLDDANTETVVDNTDGVDADGADEVVAGDSTVDWRRAKPELVASEASENVHVFVDGRPVGTLVKAKASAGVAAQWDKPALRVGFAQAAAEGLMPETAAEFGFVAHSFVVKGDEVFRQTMRRVADINTRNSQREVAAGQERYQQAVKTSFLAAVKGVYPDLKNPVRDSLVASLHKCGVVDARTVVDKAFASLGDALVAGIFDKAKDLAAKPDAARNEAAQFVAQAAYQSRDVDPAVDLASRLAEGNRAAIPAAPVKPQQEVAKAGTTTADRVRAALRSIGR